MKGGKGISIRLYGLIGFVMIFILIITSFSWITFKNFNEKHKNRLQITAEYINIVDETRQAEVDFKKQVQEWKNTLLRGYDPESFKKYYSQFSKENDNVQSQLLKLKEDMDKQGMDTSSVDTLLSNHKELYDKYNKAIKSYDPNNIESYRIVDGLVKGMDRKPTDDMDLLVKQIQDKAKLEMEEMIKQSDIDANNFNRNLIYEAKDTSIIVSASSKDITKASDQISTSAEEVAGTIVSIAENASKQTELAEESDKAVHGVVEGLNIITENTVYINELANNAMETVISGTTSLKEQGDRMANTKKASQNVADVVSELSTKSNEIGKVVEFINQITGQINLLSLNASIEAARAGEAGRGFTVVANETNEINENAVSVEKSIKNMVTIIDQNASGTEEVASVTEEQTASIEEVASSMNNLAEMSNSLCESLSKFKV